MKPNIRKLRDAWLIAWRAWLNGCAERGVDPYDDEGLGKLVGRGKNKKPDALRELFDAMEAARLAYLGGDNGGN